MPNSFKINLLYVGTSVFVSCNATPFITKKKYIIPSLILILSNLINLFSNSILSEFTGNSFVYFVKVTLDCFTE